MDSEPENTAEVFVRLRNGQLAGTTILPQTMKASGSAAAATILPSSRLPQMPLSSWKQTGTKQVMTCSSQTLSWTSLTWGPSFRAFSVLKPGGMFYFTINFDGATLFQPEISPYLDAKIESLYHRTMDERVTNGKPSGDSRTGRHFFHHARMARAEILEAVRQTGWCSRTQAVTGKTRRISFISSFTATSWLCLGALNLIHPLRSMDCRETPTDRRG